MNICLLALTLLMQPIIASIPLTDDLTIEAMYADKGTTLSQEAMLLTIADFAHVHTELVSCGEACNLRISSIAEEAKKTLDLVHERYTVRLADYEQQVTDLLTREKNLEIVVKDISSEYMWFRLGAYSAAASLVGLTIYTAVR